MERSLWMYNLSRLDPSYVVKVQKFIDAMKIHAQRTTVKHICCPCTHCKSIVVSDNVEAIISHLVCRGFMEYYLIWTKHGKGSFAPYMRTTDNTAMNINVEGPMPHVNKCHAMPDINETHHASQISIKLIMLHLVSMELSMLRQQRSLCMMSRRIVPNSGRHYGLFFSS